jgi:hypothetical protein
MIRFFQAKKDRINGFLLFFLISYFAAIVLPYCFRLVPALNSFFLSTGSKLAYRGMTVLYFLVYSSLVGIANQRKIKIHWAVLLLILIAMFCLAWTVTPSSFSYVAVQFNRAFVYYFLSVGTFDFLVSLGLFSLECILFLFLVSFLPGAVTSKKPILVFLIFVCGFCATVCLISYFLDFRLYFGLAVDGVVSEYGISSIFHNKNEFGIFVFMGCFCSAILCFFLPKKRNIVFIVSFFQFLFTSLLIKCFTAALPCLFLALALFVYKMVLFYRSSKPLFLTLLLSFFVLTSGLSICVSLPSVRSSFKLFSALYSTVTNFGDEIVSRTAVWDLTPIILDGPSLLLGKTDAIANAELSALLAVKKTAVLIDFHDSFVSFLTSHGLAGLVVYLAIHAWVVKQVGHLYKTNQQASIVLGITFFGCVLFSMPESYTLFINMSVSVFPINVVFLLFLPFLNKIPSPEISEVSAVKYHEAVQL